MRAAAIAVLAAMLWAPALAQPTPVRTPADWIRQPTWQEVYTARPNTAEALNGAEVEIVCTVTTRGILVDCRVVRETPAGAGFGRAALTLSQRFVLSPATENGRPVESQVRIPITWGRHEPRPMRQQHPVVRGLPWTGAPTIAELNAAVPARMRGRFGRAEIVCRLMSDGRADDCFVTMAHPTDAGFGPLVRRLGERFRVAPNSWPNARSTLNYSVVMIPFVFPADAAGETETVQRPTWLAQPTTEEIAAAFPAAARAANVQRGVASMTCAVVAGGRLDGCRTVLESAEGFGAAALALADRYRMDLWTIEGRPTVGGTVSVTVAFQ